MLGDARRLAEDETFFVLPSFALVMMILYYLHLVCRNKKYNTL